MIMAMAKQGIIYTTLQKWSMNVQSLTPKPIRLGHEVMYDQPKHCLVSHIQMILKIFS